MKRLCSECGKRPAHFRVRKTARRRHLSAMRADDDHNLCPECYRRALDHNKASQMASEKES